MKINEIFYSIQGEGLNMGLPSVFVRTTGCNLRCSYCDTEYAFNKGKDMSISEIEKYVNRFPIKRTCITGGEPLLQNDLAELLARLNDYDNSIETNGTIDIGPFKDHAMISMDIKCPSSGEEMHFLEQNIDYLTIKDQVKFVVATHQDLKYAKEKIIQYDLCKRSNVIINPVFGTDYQSLAKSILEMNLDVRMGIQLHKIIWNEKLRGV